MRLLKYTFILFLSISTTHSTFAQQAISLQEALSIAISANPELKSAELEVRKAEQQKIIATSQFLPSIYAGASANHYFTLPAFFGFGQNSETEKIPYGRFGGKDQLGAFVSMVQPIFSPSASPSFQYSQVLKQEALAAAKAKEIEIMSEIKETYLRILVLNERISLKQESINRNKRVLQDSRILFLQGKGLRVDTLRAYTSLKNLEPDLVKLVFEVETSMLQLKTIIGLDSGVELKLSDSLLIPVNEAVPLEEEFYEEVKNTNPDLKVLTLQSELEEQQVRLANADRKPRISLVGAYQVQSQTNNLDYANAYYPASSYLGLQLALPLFSGFATVAKARQANLRSDQVALDVNFTKEKLKSEVHAAIASYKEAILRLETTSIVKETAQLSYNIMQYRYQNGISPRLELTDAELALSMAQSNYLEAVYDLLVSRIELRKLAGASDI
jgi:outer membrane protein TolC